MDNNQNNNQNNPQTFPLGSTWILNPNRSKPGEPIWFEIKNTGSAITTVRHW